MKSPSAQPAAGRGFTLLELTIIVVLLGILAATAIPAFATASETRGIVATREVERRLVHARSRAIATGEPTGIAFDSAGALTMVRIASQGQSPTPAPGPTGEKGLPWSIGSAFSGVGLSKIVGGDGSTASTQTIWFGYDGSPELRTPSGTLIGPFSQDALITLSGPGSGSVMILRGSGVVER